MNRNPGLRTFVTAALCAVAVVFPTTRLAGQVVSLDPAKMARIGTVDERFQSYNIEMVEVIGERFWKPYGSTTNESKAQEARPPGRFHSGRHRPRTSIDIERPLIFQIRDCESAVLGPVPAAPRILIAKSRESSTATTARLCSGRKMVR